MFWLNRYSSSYGEIKDGFLYLAEPKQDYMYKNKHHTLAELEQFNEYVEELTKNYKPEEIDNEIFNTKVAHVRNRANETAPGSKYKNRRAFENLDALAPNFNKEPVYKEEFREIQHRALEMQKAKEELDKPFKLAKDELKDFKIELK